MKEIILLIGLPGSGKDTWSLEQIRKYPGKYKRITKDMLREMMDDSRFSNDNEKMTLEVRDEIVKKSLSRGYSVIISDTNFPVGGKHFKRMCEIAKLVGNVRVWEKYFDVDIKECKRRNLLRSRIVPEEVIDRMFEKYIKGRSFTLGDEYFPKYEKIPYNFDLPDCVIFDIDGTLAHMNDRSPYEWSKVGEDKSDVYLSIISKYLKTDTNLFIFTGRDGSCLNETKNWLDLANIGYDKIFIRPAGNMEKDSLIKERMYNENIKGKYNVLSIFDDRNQVVEMWRLLGLTCCQVNYGDF